MEQKFIHLQIHSEFSIIDGLSSIPELIDQARQLQMGALALTDVNNLYGAIKFYQKALAAGIKPILGTELYLQNEEKKEQPFKIILLCKNLKGYQNLLKLISKSHLEGQEYGTPCIKQEWLANFYEGLIILLGFNSDLGTFLFANNYEKIKLTFCFWEKYFKNNLYLAISRTGKPHEETFIKLATIFAEKYHLPVVATNDVRFLRKQDFDAHETRVCIQQGVILNDNHRPKNYTEQQYFRSQQEMQQLFADMPEVLQNSVEIAKRCNVVLTLGQNRLPNFTAPSNTTTEEYLSLLAKEGLTKRLQKNPHSSLASRAYEERLDYELKIINKMGFAGYFLIVADFTKWAKENGIPVGPGRGSGSGSLVAFALEITDLDPLELNLLFERFLNEERVSMPDFDIDFCMEGRDRVIEYVIKKHGIDAVSHIITYGTMAAKGVVRDVGRVLGLNYGFVDKIAKLIPFELGMTLEKALTLEPLLQERYQKEEEVQTLINLARKLEGIVRNVGKHAGGIVIAPGKLTDFVPLYCEAQDTAHPATQFDKDDVELVGLVKFDFLGLKTLTIIDRTLQIVNTELKKENKSPIDINLIPLNDVATFKILKACQTSAVFQLESSGMRDLVKRLQPDCFEDLIALVALFRPGPLQSGMVDDFINRKHGRAAVSYPHPDLESILSNTYGVILYQEQVMQIAQKLAGYTLGSADILRRAMGKKKPEEMAKQREIFCAGAKASGVDKQLAMHIFDLMEKFAGYGFNRPHAAAYALISYQTAWLKTHYPAAFMSAVLSSDMDRTDKVLNALKECKQLKLNILPPDINESDFFFKVVGKDQLRYGLGAIKGMGKAAIENILTSRRQYIFKNLFDFCQRIDARKVNKRSLEALIKSGSFDCFKENRAVILATLEDALLQAEQQLNNQLCGQQDLLSSFTEEQQIVYRPAIPWSEEFQLKGEKETLGFYLTGHPLNRYNNEIKHLATINIPDALSSDNKGNHVRLIGMISSLKIRQTKKGQRFAIFKLDDGSEQIEVVCFADVFAQHRALLNEDQLIIAEGAINLDEFSQQNRLNCQNLLTIDEARNKYAKSLQISIQSQLNFDLQQFQKIINNAQGGKCPVILRFLQDKMDNIKAELTLGKQWLIHLSEDLLATLRKELNMEVNIIY